MGISQGNTTLSLEEILNKVTERDLLSLYFNIKELPVVICSPLREDNNPSFGLSSPDGIKVRYKDFATGESGSIIDLLQKLWDCDFKECITRIVKDNGSAIINNRVHRHSTYHTSDTKLEVKIRDWKNYDIEYWMQFNINKIALTAANIYPISHYIIIKDGNKYIYGADKYAYAFFEFKENNPTIKVYQPYNKEKHKWISKHDKSVLGLWNLLPSKGKIVCICSSVKDALCLYVNTGIPSICLQGESYNISITAQNVLKERFENICVLLDSDNAGIEDANKLCKETNFINIQLPISTEFKDIAEYYTYLNNKQLFKNNIIKLFKEKL